jgi:diaminopimelate decarboxylase
MPKVEVGDFIIVADTGAYALSMFSRWVSHVWPVMAMRF